MYDPVPSNVSLIGLHLCLVCPGNAFADRRPARAREDGAAEAAKGCSATVC